MLACSLAVPPFQPLSITSKPTVSSLSPCDGRLPRSTNIPRTSLNWGSESIRWPRWGTQHFPSRPPLRKHFAGINTESLIARNDFPLFAARAGRQAGEQAPCADDDKLAGVFDNLACATPDHQMLDRRICSPPHSLSPALASPSGPCQGYLHKVFMQHPTANLLAGDSYSSCH